MPLQYQPSQMNQTLLVSNRVCTTLEGSTNGQQYFVYNPNSETRYMTCALSPNEAVKNVQNLPLNTQLFSGSAQGGNQAQCILVPSQQTSVAYAIYDPVTNS